MDELAVVTGAGGGLGRALSVVLARQGVRVVGLGRSAGALEETAGLIGERFVAMPCDVADAAAVRAAFVEVDRIGAVTILVNNAAVHPRHDILDETAESFAATVDVNLGGTVACTVAALGRMVATGTGRIVNVGTFADVAPLPASAAYAVSKGAQRIFTRTLVADLHDRFPGIVVNDWMPGMLDTGMGVPDGIEAEVAAEWGAALALWRDASLTGTVWERDREVLPPRAVAERLRDRLTGRRRVARRITT